MNFADLQALALLGELGRKYTLTDMISVQKYLMGIKGSQFVSIIANTEPRMRKTNNPYIGRVRKIARVNGIVNFHYDEGVLRRLEKEGKSAEDFRKGESWHEPVVTENGSLTPFCRHKTSGELYLRLMLNNLTSEYIDVVNNHTVDEKDIAPFLVKNGYDNQGLDQPLRFLTYKMDSIKVVSANGKTFLMV